MQRGLWAKAKAGLDELLTKHANSFDAIACREALVEDMARCMFGVSAEAPKPEMLVNGKLLTWNERSGRLRIVYTPDTMGDFTGDAADPESLRVHPVTFAGDYTLTWTGEQATDQHLTVLCQLGSPNEFLVDFGGSARNGFHPARLLRFRDGEERTQVQDIRERQENGAYVATVEVGKRAVESCAPPAVRRRRRRRVRRTHGAPGRRVRRRRRTAPPAGLCCPHRAWSGRLAHGRAPVIAALRRRGRTATRIPDFRRAAACGPIPRPGATTVPPVAIAPPHTAPSPSR